MSTIFRLAWRNLWRNKRRTIITVASVFSGLLVSAYMTSMNEGRYDKMVDLVVKYYSGYIQVQEVNYWQNKSINNSFDISDSLLQQIIKHAEVSRVFSRLESFSLVSSGNLTKGAIVSGIEPEAEDQWTGISQKIRQGTWLMKEDKGAVIGETLSRYLKISAGDTLVMVSQGYHGTSAAQKFPVRGIVRHVSPELDKMLVYLDINTCRDFFSCYGKVTSLVVNVGDPDDMTPLLGKLKKEIRLPLCVMSWKEMQPEIVQHIESDRAGSSLLKLVLFIVIGFGILSVVMMMVSERKKEMGVLVAVGMQKTKLALVLLSETLIIGLLGLAAGIIAGIPLICYQSAHPIPLTGKTGSMIRDFGFEPYLFFSTSARVFINQVLILLFMTLAVSVYPVATALRFNPSKAFRK